MKIGLIGLGDIAQKAYLPVMSTKEGVELILCTRNKETLNKLSSMYNIKETAQTVDELIEKGIDAAFVHAATKAHVEIAEKLLKNGINVYVDKPIGYTYEESKKVVDLAKENGKILMVGFNRRFAPMYKNLKTQGLPSNIILQKNRTFSPADAREFIFDDFIHVVDTLRFLLPGEIEDINMKKLEKNGLLYSVTIELTSKGCNAIGIMNRDSGINEEVLEFITSGHKWRVRDLNEMVHYSDGHEEVIRFNDWDHVLYRRGFYQITDHFIDSVKEKREPTPSAYDSLITHEILEKIVNY